jgi:hypothetical protein
MRSWWLLLVPVLLLVASAAQADRVRLASGRLFEQAHVERFETVGGKAVFWIRAVARDTEPAHPTEADLIAFIRFGPAGHDDQQTRNAARLELTNGTIFERVHVSVYLREGGDGHFLVSESADGTAEPFPVEAAIVRALRFEPPVAAVAEPTPAVADPPTSPALVRRPVVPVEYEEEPEWVFNPLMPDPRYLTPGGQGAEPFIDLTRLAGRPSAARPDSGLPDFLTRRFRVPYIGLDVSLVGWLLYVLVGSIAGAWHLRMVARAEAIARYTWKRAGWSAVGMAAVASTAMYLSSRYIPGIGFFVGAAAGFLTMRIGVMASLEVLEEKAQSVVTLFAAVQTALAILIPVVANQFV